MEGDRIAADDRKRISQLEEQADLLTAQVESLSASMETLTAEVSSLRDADRRVARLEEAVHRALDVFMPRVDALLALHDGRAAAAGAALRSSSRPGPSEASSCPSDRSYASNLSRATEVSHAFGPSGSSSQSGSLSLCHLLSTFYPTDPLDSSNQIPLDVSHVPTSSAGDLVGSAGLSTILADASVQAPPSDTLDLSVTVPADAEELSVLSSSSAASCPSTPSDPTTPRDPSVSSGPSTPSGSFATSGSSTPTGASTPSGLSVISSSSSSTSGLRPRSVLVSAQFDVEPSCSSALDAITCRSSSASRAAAAIARASPPSALWIDAPASASRANAAAAAADTAGHVAPSTAPTAPVLPVEATEIVSLWSHMPRRPSSPRPPRRRKSRARESAVESVEADEETASLDEASASGRTALHDAAEQGDVPTLEALLAIGANVEVRDHLGWSALHFAARAGHTSCVKLLLQNGAEKDAKTNLEYTPLHWACFWSRTECVQVLLDAGASTSVKNIHGKTPLEIADSKDVQQLFRKRYRFFRFF